MKKAIENLACVLILDVVIIAPIMLPLFLELL